MKPPSTEWGSPSYLTWREQRKDAVKGVFHAFSKSVEEEVEIGKVPSQDQLKCFLFQYPAE